MIKLKSHIRRSPLGLIPVGDHIVTVDSITEAYAKDNNAEWVDRTPQLAIKFKSHLGFITQWVNVVGYMTKDDYTNGSEAIAGVKFCKHPYSGIYYAVDVFTNERVISEPKTITCMHILGRIANCCGVEEGLEFDITDLIGRELAIRVAAVNGQNKVTHTFKSI